MQGALDCARVGFVVVTRPSPAKVTSTPTFVFIRDGAPLDQFSGSNDVTLFVKMLKYTKKEEKPQKDTWGKSFGAKERASRGTNPEGAASGPAG